MKKATCTAFSKSENVFARSVLCHETICNFQSFTRFSGDCLSKNTSQRYIMDLSSYFERYCWQTQRSKIKVEAEMCLKIQSPWPMPAETERIGRKLLKENDVYRLIGELNQRPSDYRLYSSSAMILLRKNGCLSKIKVRL